MSHWAAVLAGGSGTRFWPLSMPDEPKQFQALVGNEPLLVQAVDRLRGLIDPQRILVVTGESFRNRTQNLLNIPPENVLGEPRPASTAAALAWATSWAQQRDPEAGIISVHADWFVGDDEAFCTCARNALDVAEVHDVLVTVGVSPTRVETAYGHIIPGEDLDGRAKRVERFVEKPKAEVAQRLMNEGALWNCGMFAWTANRFREETEQHAPEIAPFLELLESGETDAFFDRVTPIVIDKSHFERSDRVAVVAGTFPWDDVGTWNALPRVRELDEWGNVKSADVMLDETQNCIVWPGNERIALYGVTDLVVARAHGYTLVTTRAKAADLKKFVEQLPAEWNTPL